MELRFIGRGVLAGALGGLLTYVFARILAEPVIGSAIDYESGRAAVLGEAEEHEMFSRTVQGWLGLGVGLVLFGAAMGALFAVAYAVCVGRTGGVRPRALSLLVAAAGFGFFYLVPFLKYPANPPAVGHADTIRERTELYVVMVFCSVLFGFLGVYLGQRLAARRGNWTASLLAAAGFVVATGVVMVLLPGVHETPGPLRRDGDIAYPGFPADVLYRFRLYAVGAQLVLWTTIGVVFAPMAERLLRPQQAPERSAASV